MCLLSKLPDELLYKILSYVETEASLAPFVARVLCRVNRAMKRTFDNDNIWDMILSGYEYQKAARSELLFVGRKRRRESSRLRRSTAKEEVIHAHWVLRDQTEMAIQDVAELCVLGKPNKLNLSRLRAIFHRYGNVNINQRSRNGETFLVECCRARHISERVIVHCITELVSVHHANPNIPAFEGSTRATVTALVVAAARGMPSVVKYLLSVGAVIHQEGTCRFRCHTNPNKSIRGTYTPLDFAKRMRETEIIYGASEEDLQSIDSCIEILGKHGTTTEIS